MAGKVTRGGTVRPMIIQRAKKIRLLILDVDGVLTDGSIILDNEGNEYKSFHVRDGHGIKMLLSAGVRVALVTGRESKIVARRARELGITDVFQKCFDKAVAYAALVEKYGLSEKEIAYAPIMKKVGLPIRVADSAEEIKEYALMVTRNGGGRGAVREVADVILKSKGLWREMFDEYFET
jgi:3-deoxy-D-manno-octulosonate 8-phosphate phosphatase (KDO 8-P phosphatase)